MRRTCCGDGRDWELVTGVGCEEGHEERDETEFIDGVQCLVGCFPGTHRSH